MQLDSANAVQADVDLLTFPLQVRILGHLGVCLDLQGLKGLGLEWFGQLAPRHGVLLEVPHTSQD